VHPSIELLLRS